MILAKDIKILIALIPVVLLGPMAMDIFLPALGEIQQFFLMNTNQVQWTLSIFVLGYGLCQLFVGKLTKPQHTFKTLILAVTTFMFASLVCALAQQKIIFFVGRLLQAISACFCTVIAFAITRRAASSDKACAKICSIISGFTGFAPIVAPSIGGFIIAVSNWHFVFYIQAAVAFISLLFLLRLIGQKFIFVKSVDNTMDYHVVYSDPMFWRYACYGSGGMVILFTFFSVAHNIFVSKLGLSNHLFPYVFSIYAAGFVIGSFLNAYLIDTVDLNLILNRAMAAVSGIAIVIVLQSYFIASLGLSVILMFLINFCLGFVFSSALPGALINYKGLSEIASSVYGAQQFLIAFLLTTFYVAYFQINLKSLGCFVFFVSVLTLIVSFILQSKYRGCLNAQHKSVM